jgi:type I restriction enzyme S subunit
MNPAQFLSHLDRISEAPDAIPRLGRFILDLAVRGKLVEQDSKDESASELLKRIQTEKARLVKEGKIGNQEPFESIEESEIPFQIPQTWEWVPATFPAYLISDMGKKVQTKDVLESGEFPVVDQGKVFIRGYCNDRNRVIHIDAPIVLFGDHTRETKLINFDFVVGADGVKLLHPVCILTDYYYLALKWLPLDSRGYGRHFKLLRAATLPLPPLAEQHRIVAKVDELMALCDRLEAVQAERENRRIRLATSSLQRLNQPAEEASAFRKHARFYFNRLPRLTTRPEHIQQLRQTILNLAVRGQLVPQDPNDEPASELFKRIQAEKARLVKEGKIKKERPLPDIGESSVLFDLPDGWSWVRLGDLSQLVTSGSRDWAKFYSGEGAIFVRMGNLSRSSYRLRLDNIQRVKPPTDSEGARTKLEEGDILISITGEVGLLGLVPPGFGDAYINQHTCLVRPMSPLRNRYLPELFRSPFAQNQFNEPQRGIKNSFRLTDVTQLVAPLPPLAEQHRIVAKVDELMALCDRLEAQLTTTQTESRRLLEAVLHEALTPALEKIA